MRSEQPYSSTNTAMPARVIQTLLAHLYSIYYATLLRLGEAESDSHDSHAAVTVRTSSHVIADLASLDEAATRIGAAYRGIGVLIGLLGAIIILCALLPVGYDLTDISAHRIGIAKVVLMTLLLVLMLLVKRLGMKEAWVELRQSAEYLRYQNLREAIEKSKNGDASSLEALVREVQRHIGNGLESQRVYNERKRKDYERIERFSIKVTYMGFAVSFGAAAIHLFFHFQWLIFLTVYVPAVIGAMHAVNNFLRLPQLINRHGALAQHILELENRFADVMASHEVRERLPLLAAALLRLLESGDKGWSKIAIHQDVHPV